MSSVALDIQTVVDAMSRGHAVEILRALDEPRSAQAVSEEADVPIATAYRVLPELVEAGLVGKFDGYKSTEYYRLVSEVRLEFDEYQEPPAATASERRSVRLEEVAD